MRGFKIVCNIIISSVFGLIRTPAFIYTVVTAGVIFAITLTFTKVLEVALRVLKLSGRIKGPVIFSLYPFILCITVFWGVYDQAKPIVESQTVIPVSVPIRTLDHYLKNDLNLFNLDENFLYPKSYERHVKSTSSLTDTERSERILGFEYFNLLLVNLFVMCSGFWYQLYFVVDRFLSRFFI